MLLKLRKYKNDSTQWKSAAILKLETFLTELIRSYIVLALEFAAFLMKETVNFQLCKVSKITWMGIEDFYKIVSESESKIFQNERERMNFWWSP